ncbi:hypothetical protein BDZ94DRAFT_1149765, partial [Collybia nuda]
GVGGVANLFMKMRQSPGRTKAHHIESNSGAPRSHDGLAAVDGMSQLVSVTETFVCKDGVTVPHLLRATRGALFEEAESVGANALINEQWSCRICGPKHRSDGTFRVQTRYSATAIRSNRPDPHNPVALDQVKNVPGLMNITSR